MNEKETCVECGFRLMPLVGMDPVMECRLTGFTFPVEVGESATCRCFTPESEEYRKLSAEMDAIIFKLKRDTK